MSRSAELSTVSTGLSARRHWRWLALAAWTLLNIVPAALTAWSNWTFDPLPDWQVFGLNAGRLLTGQDIYAPPRPFVYSPVMAAVLAPFVLLGYPVWAALHVAALALLRNRWLIAVVLVSWPFWTDLAAGNLFTFVFVVAYCAVRGKRWAEWAYLAACLMMPRPVQLPLLLFLLWHRPHLRLGFVALFVVHAVAVVASGQAWGWWQILVVQGGLEMAAEWNVGPSRIIGAWWLLVGVPLAAVLLWRGRPALSGLALSPYWLPYYLLLPLADATISRQQRTNPQGEVGEVRDGAAQPQDGQRRHPADDRRRRGVEIG